MQNSDLLQTLINKHQLCQASVELSNTYVPCQQKSLGNSLSLTVSEIDNALPDGGLRVGALHEFFGTDAFNPTLPLTIPTLIAMKAHDDLLHRYQNNLWQKGHWRRASQESVCIPTTVWIGRACWPTPQFLQAAGFLQATGFLQTTEFPETTHLCKSTHQQDTSILAHSLFIDPPSEKLTLWAIETALSSRSVSVLVAVCPPFSRTTSQRLAHVAKRSGTTALLLRSHKEATKPSYAHSRWRVAPHPTSFDTPHWELCLKRLKGSGLHDISWQVGLQPFDFFNPSFPSLMLSQQHNQTAKSTRPATETNLVRYG